jgi:NADH-quinone oxidoreductase subunit H
MTLFLIYKIILVVLVFAITMGVAAYSTYAERKIAAFMQDRLGPNRAGPYGLLQPIADGMKFFFKEDFAPADADKWLFVAGPSLAMLIALLTSAVIPWSTALQLGGQSFPLQVTDLNIGVLYITGAVSIGVYGIMIGGWASNNKFALLGAIRASSQMISYEIGMGIALIAIVLLSGSLSIHDIVTQQSGQLYNFSWMPNGMAWNIFYQPIGFIIFLVCAFAECNRTPFDLPECEQELVGGYHTEYSSMKLGMFMFSEYVNMFVSSALISSLYFGGYSFPFMDASIFQSSPNLLAFVGFCVLFAKILFFIFFFMWIRWTIPRFRYDQLMHLGWRVLMPLAIVNMLLTGLGVLGAPQLRAMLGWG